MASSTTPKARVACLLSGNGTTMSALLFQSRLPGCPYEIVLVASNKAQQILNQVNRLSKPMQSRTCPKNKASNKRRQSRHRLLHPPLKILK